jgi:hypothetical protein
VEPFDIAAEVVGQEVRIAAGAGAYQALADAIEGGWRGSRLLSVSRCPTGAPLDELAAEETAEPRARFTPQGGVLVISGSPAALGRLATNLRGLGTIVKPGTHTHWDYFEGHPLLDSSSAPLVIEVTAKSSV